MSSELDSKAFAEDEDKKLYDFIYDMDSRFLREENESTEIPSSSEHSPVHLKISAESRSHADVSSPSCIDMDSLDCVEGIPAPSVNVKEKPWSKPGADISDYFNYGFDEETWNAYCKRQAKLLGANGKRYTKTRVQKRHTKHREKEPCCEHSPSGSPPIPATRESNATTDVTEGQPGSSSNVEELCCLRDEGNNSQVLTKTPKAEDRIAFFHLNRPSNFSSLIAYTPPPPFLYRPEPLAPLLSTATLDSGHTKESDGPLTSQYPCSSGASSLIPGSIASSAGVIKTAKAWECQIWQEVRDRDRSRKRGPVKGSKRGRNRESESRASSHNSGEERMRHRDTKERRHRHHNFERVCGEKEEQHTERRHKSKGQQKSTRSSSSSSRNRRDDGEERESQSRHKRKKAK